MFSGKSLPSSRESIELTQLPDNRERWREEQKRAEKVMMINDTYSRLHPIIEDIFIKFTGEATPAILFDRWLKTHEILRNEAKPIDDELSVLIKRAELEKKNDTSLTEELSNQIVSLVTKKRKLTGVYGSPFIDIDQEMIEVLSKLTSRPISDQKEMDRLGLTVAFSFPTPENISVFLNHLESHVKKNPEGNIALTEKIVALRIERQRQHVAAAGYARNNIFSSPSSESKAELSMRDRVESPQVLDGDDSTVSSKPMIDDNSPSEASSTESMTMSPTVSPRL